MNTDGNSMIISRNIELDTLWKKINKPLTNEIDQICGLIYCSNNDVTITSDDEPLPNISIPIWSCVQI